MTDARRSKDIKSAISWSTEDEIFVRGKELNREILGHMSLPGMAWLEITGRDPSEQEERVFEAVLMVLVEHGVNPSVLSARLTLAGAPDSLQGAIVAGILGVGGRVAGTMEGSARMISEALADAGDDPDLEEIARAVVETRRATRTLIPGVGHPLHDPDPRAARLFEIAAENGFQSAPTRLIQLISAATGDALGRSMPVNVTGAIGAIVCELDFPPEVARGIAIIGRTIGLTAHLLEEMRDPLAMEVAWRLHEDINKPV